MDDQLFLRGWAHHMTAGEDMRRKLVVHLRTAAEQRWGLDGVAAHALEAEAQAIEDNNLLGLSEPVAMIHVLRLGFPLCGFSDELPGGWPEGHSWVGLDSPSSANCEQCLAKLPEVGKKTAGVSRMTVGVLIEKLSEFGPGQLVACEDREPGEGCTLGEVLQPRVVRALWHSNGYAPHSKGGEEVVVLSSYEHSPTGLGEDSSS